MNQDKNRVLYLDNICGLLILNMVFFVHIRMYADVTTGIIPYVDRLLCFFMPWFFYKSGMFYHDDSLKQRVNKDYKTLLVPYLFFTAFGWIVYCCYLIITGDLSLQHLVLIPMKEIVTNEAIAWNGALWFLPSLFLVKILACVLFKRSNAFICLTVSAAAAVIIHYTGFSYPNYLANIILGLFFYSLGYLMRSAQFKPIVFIAASVYYIISIAVPFITGYFDFRYNMTHEGDNYFLVIAYAVSGIILYNNLFRIFMDKDVPVLSGIGRTSIVILCIHYPIVKLLTGIFSQINGCTSVQLWCLVTISIIPIIWLLVLLINRKARFLIGK